MVRVLNKGLVMFYQEITLLEQPDINLYHVYTDVYGVIHNMLHQSLRRYSDADSTRIGVAFPEYHYNSRKHAGSLGRKVRLFAKSAGELQALNVRDMLGRFSDYAHVSPIEAVGDKPTHYEVYTRYRYKSVKKKALSLQAHLIKTKGQAWYNDNFGSFDAILEHCERNRVSPTHHPYISLSSASTEQQYKVSITRDVVEKPTESFLFNEYGLSLKENPSSVPAW